MRATLSRSAPASTRLDQGWTGVFAGATQRPERHACLAVAHVAATIEQHHARPAWRSTDRRWRSEFAGSSRSNRRRSMNTPQNPELEQKLKEVRELYADAPEIA